MAPTNVSITASCSRSAAAVRLKIQSKASCSAVRRQPDFCESKSRRAGRALTKKAPLASTMTVTTAAVSAARAGTLGSRTAARSSAASSTRERRMTSAGRNVST